MHTKTCIHTYIHTHTITDILYGDLFDGIKTSELKAWCDGKPQTASAVEPSKVDHGEGQQ